MRTLTFKLEVLLRDLTDEEATDAGLDDACEAGQEVEDCIPDCHDFAPDELGRLIAHALIHEDVQSEMFAGTGIFAKIERVSASPVEA